LSPSFFSLVSVGAEVGVSIGLPHDGQKRLPSGASLAHEPQRIIGSIFPCRAWLASIAQPGRNPKEKPWTGL
jgi:hypothetical protein